MLQDRKMDTEKRDTAKVVLRGKFILINIYIKKKT